MLRPKKTSPKPEVVPTSNWKKKDDEITSAVKPVEEKEFDVVAATTTVYNQYQLTASDRQRIEARVQQRLNMLNGGNGGTVEEYLADVAPDGDKKPTRST